MGKLRLLLQIALRNIFASKMNWIIGGLIFGGTLLVVVGGGLLGSMEDAMGKSVTSSLAGDIQIYSANAKDKIALLGDFGGDPDIGAMDEFDKIRSELQQLPEVKTVVPMGIAGALVTTGNSIDIALAKLRDLYNQKQGHGAAVEGRPVTAADAPSLDAQIASQKDYVRQMIRVLQQDLKNAKELSVASLDADATEALAKTSSDAFWADFDKDPFNSLEYLDNHIAPMMSDADMLFLRYAGTNLDEFQKSFDRMEIVDGTAVPQGHRGFLFPKSFYEEQVKLKSARRLDKIHEALTEKHQTIATQPDLQRMLEDSQTQTREIIFQLDALKTAQMVSRLQKELQSKETDLGKLLAAFFKMDDASFEGRYKFFYDQMAPLLELYRVRVGDMLTIKAFSRSGYVHAVNVKVYGTFNFKGLEKSPLAGAMSLMDLVSFRELYGYLTADKVQELEALKKEAGAASIARDQAEDALFGSGAKTVEANATPGIIAEDQHLSGTAQRLRTEDLVRRVYSNDEMNKGVVLSAAVLLKDPSRTHEMIARINSLSREKGLQIQAVSWIDAVGVLGQILHVVEVFLVGAALVIFFVTLVIINNAMMMATLQRVREIGTLRAIGARKGFVVNMVLVETLCLGAVFGGAGLAVGSGIIGLIHQHGWHASADAAYMVFGGPVLRPSVSPGTLIVAFVMLLVVSLISTLYPAFLATRVSPIQAMQSDE